MTTALQDSRRLTGPNIVWDRPGAVIDVAIPDDSADAIVERWREEGRRMLDAVGWTSEDLRVRRVPGGASLVMSAPIDALYAATELNEWAWSVAAASLTGEEPEGFDSAGDRLRATIAGERRPSTIALQQASASHHVTFLSDDDLVSVGLGQGCHTWPVDRVPNPDTIDWDEIHDVPTVLVTGCNGKTTSVRLLSAIAGAAGFRPGTTSTDGIRVGAELVEAGDYSGPGGARTVLRRSEVDLAILETARGGMLRRGLALPRADVALITNVAEDHLGEFGVATLEGLAQVKLIVTRVVPAEGRVVLNADDALLVEGGRHVTAPVIWYSLHGSTPFIAAHRAAGGEAVVLEDGNVVRYRGDQRVAVLPVDRIPITMRGTARYNISNVLGVVGAAGALEIADDAIARALERFRPSRRDNPGRLNVFDLGGATVIVDFAHNPHGVRALGEMARAMPAARRLFLVGQAGDRDDDSILDLARAVWSMAPDCVVVKEMPKYLRGRELGVVPAMIERELAAAGAPPEAIIRAESELAGVRAALEWARVGDLVLLTAHENRTEMLDLMARLETSGWRPGETLPEDVARELSLTA
ncbi:MAG: Mur ligase [Gemmatimonadetes bacterium]|nr:MAG: Mur ligase [Gemmatimonadota bacterium]